MELTEKQTNLIARGINMFKEKGSERREAIATKIKQTYDIELIDYDDTMLYELLNDVVYDINENNLFTRFVMPPFTILDSRSGEWINRRNLIDSFFGSSLVGRKEGLAYGITDWGKRSGQLVGAIRKDDNGTSKFDSVLCEILLKWFGFKNCKVLDPFAGGHIRGSMASFLGYNYTGFDLSTEQIIANNARANEMGLKVTWLNDDALNLDKYIQPQSMDLVFTCPPYGDLEQYSNDLRDLSNMDWPSFRKAYWHIINKSLIALKDNRFAVWVVGDFRDSQGFYRGFVADTIKAHEHFGVKLYNEAIMLNSVGTASMRASGAFVNRKLTKIHQNVLVFYKGDVKTIKHNYSEVDRIKPFKESVQGSLF